MMAVFVLHDKFFLRALIAVASVAVTIFYSLAWGSEKSPEWIRLSPPLSFQMY